MCDGWTRTLSATSPAASPVGRHWLFRDLLHQLSVTESSNFTRIPHKTTAQNRAPCVTRSTHLRTHAHEYEERHPIGRFPYPSAITPTRYSRVGVMAFQAGTRTPAKLRVRTQGRASRAKHSFRAAQIGMAEGNPTPSAIVKKKSPKSLTIG